MSANDGLINETELRKAIEQLTPPNKLFEIRIIGKTAKPISGYFRDADHLLKEFEKVDLRRKNVYITLNYLDSSLFSREQSERFVSGVSGTNDDEVKGFRWFFVDMDPVRATGISSSDEELATSFEMAKKVGQYLEDLGFEEPVKGISGNGSHLLYRISLENTEENETLINNCLKALSMMFDTDQVQVDTGNFNPSRVCKLYGTMAQKGSNTKERPFRMSRIIGEVKDAKVTDRAYLEKLAAMLPKEEPQRPTARNNYGAKEFDIVDWMNRHGLRYRESKYKDGVKYVLNECPFNSNHKAPDSMITQAASGAIGFKCLHNSCADKRWRDVRLMFEPDAYEYNDSDRRIEEGWQKHNRDKVAEPEGEEPDNAPMFETMEMIVNREAPDPEYVRTGINKIDKALNGLEKGRLTVLSGLRAAAKSTFLSEIMLNAVEYGNTVVCYSGELSDKSFANWMLLQAAGKNHTKASAKYDGFYYVPKETQKIIAGWMSERFWLYDNKRGNNLKGLIEGIRQKCQEAKADLVIIDNLMALDVGSIDRSNEYQSQTRFMWGLKKLAQDLNVHVILVAHPRKATGFLRLDDIAGTANIGNVIDNALIIHRNNADFQRLSKEMFKWKDDFWIFQNGCTNVVEIAKDRERGTCDVFVDLYFEPESKRLKNYPAENIVYGWEEENKQFEFNDLGEEENPFE